MTDLYPLKPRPSINNFSFFVLVVFLPSLPSTSIPPQAHQEEVEVAVEEVEHVAVVHVAGAEAAAAVVDDSVAVVDVGVALVEGKSNIIKAVCFRPSFVLFVSL